MFHIRQIFLAVAKGRHEGWNFLKIRLFLGAFMNRFFGVVIVFFTFFCIKRTLSGENLSLGFLTSIDTDQTV